jgi:hypothetical protein
MNPARGARLVLRLGIDFSIALSQRGNSWDIHFLRYLLLVTNSRTD